ncbi:hypothetical protein NDU88_005980, partial [Pleurodeles waltl]
MTWRPEIKVTCTSRQSRLVSVLLPGGKGEAAYRRSKVRCVEAQGCWCRWEMWFPAVYRGAASVLDAGLAGSLGKETDDVPADFPAIRFCTNHDRTKQEFPKTKGRLPTPDLLALLRVPGGDPSIIETKKPPMCFMFGEQKKDTHGMTMGV